MSPPELFYSYQRIGAHQLFTSVKGGTQRSTEIQPGRKGTESNSDGRMDGRPDCPDNRRVDGPTPLCPSVNLPGRPVWTPRCRVVCLLDAAGAPNKASAGPISPHDVSLMLSLPPYLQQIEADCQEMKGQQWRDGGGAIREWLKVSLPCGWVEQPVGVVRKGCFDVCMLMFIWSQAQSLEGSTVWNLQDLVPCCGLIPFVLFLRLSGRRWWGGTRCTPRSTPA